MIRRSKRPALPVVITGNARSLNNKHDELEACTRYLHEYRNASLICFSESWLVEEKHTDSSFDIDGFTLKRNDRDTVNLRKTRGGGTCAYVNSRWCHPNNIHVMTRHCTPDCELLSLSMRPYYLPREFNKVIVNVVYIPCNANSTKALEEIADHLNEQFSSSPDAINIITGDFNHRHLDSTLPIYQHVTCPTRDDAILDLFYSNVKHGYTSKAMPPLGASDHNMMLMMPKYKTKLIAGKTETLSKLIWDEESCEKLRGCFECTDWSVFSDSCSNLEELNDVVTDYIKFCQDLVLVKKDIKLYPNNKPWVTKELKELLNDKKRAFMEKNERKKKEVQKEIKKKIKECRNRYKDKVEAKFKSNDMKSVWEGMKKMVGYNGKKDTVYLEKGKEQEYLDNLNKFYARFDQNDFSETIEGVRSSLTTTHEPLTVDENDVAQVFGKLKVNKSGGPDMVSARILKTCSRQLAGIFTLLFNTSLDLCQIPSAWKRSQICPVPKSTQIKQMNDLRPVALTSIPMKCLERLVLKAIICQVDSSLDPLQFAYKAKRGVDDAILLFTNNLYQHLDVPKCYVRTLFVDFSSAFNTIQPHILIPKLLEMGVNKTMSLWILEFLTNRSQYVRIKNKSQIFHSNEIVTNTGAPQGTVLAPILFSIYTNDCQNVTNNNIFVIKYADDTCIQALIKCQKEEQEYLNEVSKFVKWCDTNHLHLNVKKTKEMVFDFRKERTQHKEIEINDEKVDKVDQYRYLGVVFDENLDWRPQCDKVLKNINKRMYFLRKLRMIQIDNTLLRLFFEACVKSVMVFSVTAWGGNIRATDRTKFNRILKHSGKLTKSSMPSFAELYQEQCVQKLKKIITDKTHPLNPLVQFSCRSGRPLHIKTRTERHLRSFLPTAIRGFKK